MKIDYVAMEEAQIPHFKGGEGALGAKMFFDGTNRILVGRLEKGSTIGYHRHDTSSEIIYILSGTGTCLTEEGTEVLEPGTCHYCPKGKAHSLRNEHDEVLVFFAVVPEQ